MDKRLDNPKLFLRFESQNINKKPPARLSPMSCVKILHEIYNCSLYIVLTWKLPSHWTIKFDVISSMAIELRVSRIGRKHQLKPLERFFAASIESLSHRPNDDFLFEAFGMSSDNSSARRADPNAWIALFWLLIFFFGCCPYMVSGSFNNNETMREDFFSWYFVVEWNFLCFFFVSPRTNVYRLAKMRRSSA